MPPNFVVVGHVVRDLSPDGSTRLGGTALHAAWTIARLGHPVGVVTRCADDLVVDGIPPGVEIVRASSAHTTTFENIYQPSGRVQTVHQVAEPIQVTDIPWEWLDAPVVLLGPVAGEIAPSFATRFRRSLVAVTAQGWLRRWDGRGRVRPTGPREAFVNLPPLGAMFLSREDWTGAWEELEEACASIPILAVTLPEQGVRLRWGDAWHDIPAVPVSTVDPTGAGDVFAAAFLVRFFETRDPLTAARFAVCAAALSATGAGLAHVPDRTAVEDRLKSQE